MSVVGVKRQATTQITVFADGKPQFKPAIILEAQGRGLNPQKSRHGIKGSAYTFKKMLGATRISWYSGSIRTGITFSSTIPSSTAKVLVADIHRAQQTESVKRLLGRCKTKLSNVLGGCTAYVQPIDVSFNNPSKTHIKTSSEQHMDTHLEKYADGKITASERRVLLTKWVEDAWDKTNPRNGIGSFKK